MHRALCLDAVIRQSAASHKLLVAERHPVKAVLLRGDPQPAQDRCQDVGDVLVDGTVHGDRSRTALQGCDANIHGCSFAARS